MNDCEMQSHDDTYSLIVNYLLGCLPEAELDSFESRYLQDEVLFQELQEVEDELIDDYAVGALSGEQERLFETYFLRSAERREKLAFAQGMTARAVAWERQTELDIPSSDGAKKRREFAENALRPGSWRTPVPAWRQWAAIAAALLFAISGGTLWLRNRQLQRELIAANAESAKLRRQGETQSALVAQAKTELATEQQQAQIIEEQVDKIQSSPADQTSDVIIDTILDITYLFQLTRGEGEKKIKSLTVPANARLVRLSLEFGKVPFESFKIVIRRADDSVIWSRSGMKAKAVGDRRRVNLAIPAENLPAGNYDLVLSGVPLEGDAELVGRYYLKVDRKRPRS